MKKIMSLLLSLLMLISVGVVNVSAEESEEHQHLSTSEGIIVKEATCKELGLIQYTCDECKETYEEEIPIKGHNFVDGICSTCGEHEPYETWIIEKTDDQIYDEYKRLESEENNELIEKLLSYLSDNQKTSLNTKITSEIVKEADGNPEQLEQPLMLMTPPLKSTPPNNATIVSDADEFGTALANGGEIVLGDDITYETTAAITIVGETTIDLNGYTLDITTPSSERFSINIGTSSNSEPKLIIKDTSEGKAGSLNVKNTYTTRAAYIFYVYGTLDIQGGTINQEASYSSSYGINMNSGGTFKMSGGVIKKGTKLGSNYSLRTSTSSTSTITGGVVEDYYGTTGLVISGGIFKTQPTYEMMVTGKIAYKITDGGTYNNWYGVKDGTNVGLVGTTVYTDVTSFSNAIGGNKITVDGTKLTLTDDINLGSASANKVTFLSDITIDLAGHSITGEINGSSAYMFYVNQEDAIVTITDSVSGGVVKNSGLNATSTKYCYTVGVNKGTLVVNNATLEAYASQSNPDSTVSTYPTVLTMLTADAKAVLNGAKIKIDCGDTKRASANGIVVSGGICEVDNSEISVISGSSAIGIKSSSSTATLKIGSKNEGITTIAAETTGINNQVSSVYGIGNSSSGASGNIFVSNVDITVIGNEGGGNQAQTNGGIRFDSMTSGSYEIGNNVSILVKGTTATGKGTELYGIYAKGGGSITGSNVHVDVEGENAAKRYGMYKNNTNPFIINPGTDVTIDVNKNGYNTGENILFYASSTGLFEVSGGTYKGGTLNGLLLTGGTFDSDPSNFCDFGYIAKENTPSTGLWTVVPDERTIVKNLTQIKEYGSIVTAISEAHDHDELQLMENISSNSELTLASVNLDLNGHDISLNKINTIGDVTITDKQATNFVDAGTLTAAINVGAGNTLISKCNHSYSTNAYKNKPFIVEGTNDTLANLTISGVKGDYSFDAITQYYAIAANANSCVIINNEEGFETNLKLVSSGQNPKLIDCSGNNNEATINNGEFTIVCTGTTAGVSAAFGTSIKALVNDGKFIIESKNQTEAKIATGANDNLDIQGGYYVGLGNSGEVDKDTFFANAAYLGQNGRNSEALESTDPLYADGYRYTVAEKAVARIGDTNYMSVQSAINAANDSDTITLLSNTVARELVLNKDVTFEGDYIVTLTGDKPLTLGSGIEKPDCFDASDAMVLIEKNNGDKIYYKYWVVYGSSSVAASTDYNAEDDKQIVLVKNINLTSSWIINKDLTIDLNGFSIIDNDCSYETINLRGEHTITIKDSSTDKTGKITGKNESYTVLIQGNGTTFILESGIIENISENGAGICAIGDSYHLSEDTTITINGGEVVTNDGFAIVDNGQYSTNNTININGGEIESNGVAIYHPASGTMTLNGGTISGNTGIYIRSGKLVVPEDSTIKVRAIGEKHGHGTTTGAAYNTGDAIVIDVSDYPGGNPTADIRNGAFYSLHSFAIASYTSCSKDAIKGFLKGGIYGANQDRIDIMDVDSAKDLIALGYKDIPNPDKKTKEDYPWMIGAVHDNETTVVIGNGDTPIEAEIDDTIIIVADTNDENTVVGAPGYGVEETKNDGKSTYTATALNIGEYKNGTQLKTDGSGKKDSEQIDTESSGKQGVIVTPQVLTSAGTVVDTTDNEYIKQIVANIVASNTEMGRLKLNQATAAKAINNAEKDINNNDVTIKVTTDGTGTDEVAAKTVSIFVETYYKTVVTDDKTTQTDKSYTLDITPMYQAYASTTNDITQMKASGVTTVAMGEPKELENLSGKNITLKVQLPENFIDNINQKVYVIHHSVNGIKTYNTTVTKESDKFYIEFTNPDGFSVFEITLKNPNPTPGPTPTPIPGYVPPKTGVDGTYSNNHSLLKLSSLSLLAIGTYIAIKKKKDNEQ